MSSQPENTRTPVIRPSSSSRPRWQDPRVWLAILVTLFFAVSLYAGAVSYYDLDTRNSTDLGIFMQAFSSTTRGHPAPFYESFDCLEKARCSFLLVHPSFVLYPAVPIYGVVPSALTLFALQSAGVALAALPLYSLTRQLTGSSSKGLLAAGLFLVWAPTLGGEAFSFHVESFFPLVLFTLAALWQAQRYRWGFLVALVAFLTLEILPVFTFFVGVFFLLPALERVGRAAFGQARDWWRSQTPWAAGVRAWATVVRATLRERSVRATLGLMAASLIAYPLLYVFMNVGGAHLLGVPPPPLSPGPGGIFFNNSSPPVQSLGTIAGSSQLLYTAEFWLMLYALMAFLPFLAPRTLVLSVPWIGYTFLTDTTRYVQIGSQYTLIAAAPLFLGVAYGLVRIPLASPEGGRVSSCASGGDAPHPTKRRSARWPSRTTQRAVWATALSIVVFANVLILPVNPVLSDLGVTLPNPFQTGYQNHTLELVPGYSATEQLLGVVPPDASITAAAQLFPLVANYPHAYVLLQRNNLPLPTFPPYNLSGGFDYALVYAPLLPHLGTNTSRNLSNPALYQIRGYVGSTTVGPVLLYERGFSGAATLFGPALPSVNESFAPKAGLTPGKFSEVVENDSRPGGAGWVIVTDPAANRTGSVWTSSPDLLLPPGTYEVQAQVALFGSNLSSIHRTSFFSVKVAGFGGTPLDVSVPTSPELLSEGWVDLSWNFTTTTLLPDVTVSGSLSDAHVGLAVAGVSIQPSSGS